MAPSILHVGYDESFRSQVMVAAGFTVARAPCTREGLKASFLQSFQFSALTFELNSSAPADVVSFARTQCTAPLIVFDSPSLDLDLQLFDLVIPTHTPPLAWLTSLREAIDRSIKLRALSAQLREDTRYLSTQYREIHARLQRTLADRVDSDAFWRTADEVPTSNLSQDEPPNNDAR